MDPYCRHPSLRCGLHARKDIGCWRRSASEWAEDRLDARGWSRESSWRGCVARERTRVLCCKVPRYGSSAACIGRPARMAQAPPNRVALVPVAVPPAATHSDCARCAAACGPTETGSATNTLTRASHRTSIYLKSAATPRLRNTIFARHQITSSHSIHLQSVPRSVLHKVPCSTTVLTLSSLPLLFVRRVPCPHTDPLLRKVPPPRTRTT